MIRINDSKAMTTLKAAVLLSAFLLFAAATGFGQQVVNLTAGPTTTTLPDGTTLPMWGYSCSAAASGSTATCAPLSGANPAASSAAMGALGGVYLLNGGSGYSSSPTVTVSAPTGAITGVTNVTATATAIVSGGQIIGFNVTNHGAGYVSAPTVTITDATGVGAIAAAAPAWSPIEITVPFVSGGASLTINLTNNLSFTPAAGGTANNIPTSIVIIGQVGGGLGTSRTTTPSPNHANAQGCVTWFIASGATPPSTPCTSPQAGASGTPPVQGPRVQSMASEVAAVAPGTTSATSLTWNALRPGTYLLESGTHPSIQVPMGLIGMLVVTTAPTSTALGTAYPAFTPPTATAATQVALPAVQYNAEVPLEFSEIDPVQNKAVDLAVRTAGFSETAVWSEMNTGQVTSINLTSGGSGYTAPLSVAITGGGTGSGGATATAQLGGFISNINLTAGGTGYTSPTVTITDGTGSGASAEATVANGVITGIIITNPGSNYSAPTVTINDGAGTGAAATATVTGTPGVVYSVTLTSAGGAYTSTPTIAITGGTGTGASATAVVTTGGCGTAHTCYPPAVNYTPFYYLINGQAFDKTNPGRSLFPATAGGTPAAPVTTFSATGTVLVRLVNAGLHMHVPSIVGSQTTGFDGTGASTVVNGFQLIAEDGNPVPNLKAPRVQTDVFMAAGKTYDVMVNVPAAATVGGVPPSLPIYDRELSLSANSSIRDAGMLAYIGVNGSTLPVSAGSGVFATAAANADIYGSLAPCASTATSCIPLVISDPSRGVIANDVNVYGVELVIPPAHGSVTCNVLPSSPVAGICANGTFTYMPNPGTTADSFGYCANGAAAGTTGLCTTVSLAASSLTGPPTANAITYTSRVATYIKIPSPGVLSVDSDPNNLPLTVVTSGTTAPTAPTGASLLMDPNGGFVFSVGSATSNTACPGTAPTGSNCFKFNYYAQNSNGIQSVSPGATVTLVFPPPSNLQVKVLDAQAYNNCNGNGACIAGLVPFPDYKWIIEEDKTFYVDPNCTTNSSITTPGCPAVVGPSGQSTIPTFGVQFHTSNADYVAQGCTGPMSCEAGQTMLDTRPACTSPGNPVGCSATAGQHIAAVCDLGNGACRPDPTGNGFTPVNPSQVVLDPSKRYYISVLPGDAANPFPAYVGAPQCPALGAEAPVGNTQCGHTMSGAPIAPVCNILGGPNACNGTQTFANTTVKVLSLPTPLPTGKLSLIVFEDDYPVNGEQDSGGGSGTVAPVENGLGSFNIVLWDTYGGLGDVTGQDTYDEFNQPLSNSLAGTIDPVTGLDACPISAEASMGSAGAGAGLPGATNPGGITGMIVTCPKYESDNATLSPLAGQAVIANLMPEKFSVQAYPGADRIARGEQWLQTNTLDGQHPHDSFIRIGEPSYFQEYGPAGYHVAIGFANPAIINARHNDVCAGFGSPGAVGPCTNTIDGQVDVQRLSRTPDQRLYPSGSRDALIWTQCWVSLGDPDGEDFQFTFCDANGNFRFTNVPGGNWRLTIGDQWNDQIIDGLSTPANVGCTSTAPNQPTNATACPGGQTLHMGNIGVQQWQANLYTRTFIDDNKDGIWEPNEIGIPFLYTMIHYRDGHNANSALTDFNGVVNYNETFPLFNWYVVEADSTRYKTTGIHTVYDSGGPADGSPFCGPGNGARACGTSTAYNFLANTFEGVPLPADLSVPGAVYCKTADCSAEAASFAAGTAIPSSSTASTGRIDPPWVNSEGWSGMTSQGNWIDFGKAPYASCPPACVNVTSTPPGATTATTYPAGENGGIHGIVAYASTRPFDDASQMVQQPWESNVPRVTINLYQEGFAADGVTPTLTMVDTTQTTSWDDWAQGFYPNYLDPTTGTPLPYMNCPGQGTNANGAVNQDLFFFTLYDQPNYLDWYNSIHNGGTLHTLPHNSQYKCYDAMHVWNQLQPAPYDGEYFFPSSLGINPANGKLVSTVGSTNGVTASMAGTNCTVCVANPDSTDHYRFGTPMLPPGKYVLEVIMPPGYEVYKEEDKNLLIGDNFIAPVTQEFGGLGGFIFIIPDQASVASMYNQGNQGYNPNNFQNSTTGLGLSDELSGVPGFPGFQDPVWPCVGEMRVVPDFLSIYPQVQEVAPFAGATRPLCDRKEVNLQNQMSVRSKFAIFTSTHIAAKYTGVITDDYTSEFDPFAPMFGEKFSPPNEPVSTRDYLGNELSRVYSDHWGTYDGLTYSSWEVNPPNITGYSPSIMVQCMNDPGPILDTNPSSPTYGQMITDPLYNPAYSDFCYENPFMPGLTTYNDTPVVPTQAYIGAGYNNVDCSYPDTTPAVAEVDGDGIGPWVSAPGHTLTINSLGNVQVNNTAYAGPSANAAPFNLKTVGRHYGFGAQCTSPTASSTTCNTKSAVTIGGVAATITGWSDTQITVTVPTGVPACGIQQQKQYQGTLPTGQSATAKCGELIITAGNGRQSVDAVTVTIAGKSPTHVNAASTIQSAIDAAAPGDLLMIDPTCTITSGASTTTAASCTTSGVNGKTSAAHNEMLLMWKPVRLQGVGAVTSIIDANAEPAGKQLDPWRRHVNCLFGLTLNGVPVGSTSATGTAATYDPTGTYSCPDAGWNYFVGQVNVPQVDRLPLEAVVGWDATVNGNLAEQLQEPSLMGAYEGAGITVLAKGVWVSQGESPWTDGSEPGGYPPDALLLQDVPINPDDEGAALGPQYSYCWTTTPTGSTKTELVPNPYPSNFECNPSSIDGLTVRDSSQGGGGIFVHGWAHNLQIANNRVYNNAGTLSGGITVGQGEFPIALTVVDQEGSSGPGAPIGEFVPDNPPSCQWIPVLGTHLPYCLDNHVNVHNNYIASNSSLGDELFSGTLAGGGGATFCTGSDYYKFQYNWVCGNISSAEGGGVAHMGFIYDGDIEHNSIILNQSTNPTIPTNGGGIIVMGTPDTDPVCGNQDDQDCPPGLSDGTGPNLTINANLIQANTAESGSGGGIRLQQVNGTDVSTFFSQPQYWNSASITNNIIVNNVVGWDGGGISLEDSLNVKILNNTISSNDSLASSGVLTQSIGTPEASAPAGNCTQTGPSGANTASCPQSAGVTTEQHSPVFATSLTGLTLKCPFGSTYPCQAFSDPLLQGNIIWQNRAFIIGVGNLGQGSLNQQNLVSLFDAFTGSNAPVQTAYGQCTTGVSYWDIGVRGDSKPGPSTGSGFALHPTWSLLDDPGYTASGEHNAGFNPNFVSQYCNGSRVPPTCTVADGCGGPSGYGVPPGIADATTPNPVFSLTPSATVDEGNNWINVSWGPLSTSDDSLTGGAFGNYGGGNAFANYSIAGAIDNIPVSVATVHTDYFGNPRPDPANAAAYDPGAVEFQGGAGGAPTFSGITPNSGYRGTSVPVVITGTNFTATTTVTVTGGVTAALGTITSTTIDATFTIPSTATLGGQTVTIANAGGNVSVAGAFTVNGASLTSVSPTSIGRNSSVPVTLTGVDLEHATAITVSGTGVSCTFGSASSTTVTGTCTATATASIGGGRTILVVTPDANLGRTNAIPFPVGNAALTGITPGAGVRGTTVGVTLTGTDLEGATAVTITGGITCTLSGTPSASSVSASCVIPRTTGLGPKNVTVDTSSGNSTLLGAFQVTGATLMFSAPSPSLVSTPANTTTKTGTITVRNIAAGVTAGPFTFSTAPTVTKTSATGGTFSITGGTCTSGAVVNPGGNCTINVQYAPGGSTATATADVTATGTGLATASQTSAGFSAN